MKPRHLAWEGCTNVRDLGGLRTRDGRITRFGQIVRSDTPSRLTAAGWQALHDYGIRTIVTLRTRGLDEPALNVTPPYPEIALHSVEIEDITDPEFRHRWASSELWSTPLYYSDAIQRWPGRHAAALMALARAQPGGVLFHCIRGTDRTGIIALLLLTLLNIHPEDLLADYELSPDPDRESLLAGQNSSVSQAIFGALDGLNVETYLTSGGATPADLAALRQRLLT